MSRTADRTTEAYRERERAILRAVTLDEVLDAFRLGVRSGSLSGPQLDSLRELANAQIDGLERITVDPVKSRR